MAERADVVVVGLGPGGEDVANELAEAGLDVIGVESTLVGGECPYWACVPTKMMVRAAGALAEAGRVRELAGSASVSPDWAPVAKRIRDDATDNWDDTVAAERFEGKGGRLVRGRARFTGPRSVAVDGNEVTATRALVIATGSRPQVPPVEGLKDLPYWTNRGAVEATEVPGSLTIMGGGAVGVEFSQVFARFGAAVTVVEAADRLLPLEEPESSALVARVLEREGIRVLTGTRAESAHHDGSGFSLRLAHADGSGDAGTVRSDALLVATGRHADLAAAGVAATGLDASKRFVEVDGDLRAAAGIWAVGDVTGKGAFTHVAVYQARIATADILGRPHAPADYRALPRVTFTDPEVGAVGSTEAQARDAGLRVGTSFVDLPDTARGWIHKSGNDGFVKLVADSSRRVLVGATSVGPMGGEVLGALAVAVHAAVPVQQLRDMIYAYPTFHRAIDDAVRRLP
jgi:pyruvate/2-oxoglutarate dehydrogenase complex dihydrolipoamide dehydrogenase (E3) component